MANTAQTQTSQHPPLKAKHKKIRISQIQPYLLIAPALIVLIAIVAYPLIYGIGLSFTNMNVRTFNNPEFIGLGNYISILTSGELFTTFIRTIVWTVVNVFFHATIGLGLAMLLNRKLPFKNLFRVLLMIPWAIPQYIAVITWKNMFRLEYGAIDILLQRIGISGPAWLTNPKWTFVASIITNIWLGFPFMMMTFLGGLQSIPGELYEAGDLDGVSAWQKFRHITLPLLKPVSIPAITLGSVWTFNMVNVIFIMTDGKGSDATQILATKVYMDAFSRFAYGKAAAVSVVIFLILLAFSTLFLRLTRSDEGVY